MAAMGVIKALQPKKQWGQVQHADRYLRGELETQIQEGTVKTQGSLYDAIGCERDHFTATLRLLMKCHGEKKVKAYEYVQSFSPEDRSAGLTPELAHQIGMEFAQKFFAGYPCLVVTHIDTAHLHNQFLIGNIHETTGKCLQLNAKTLAEMKRFAGGQCMKHGLSASLFEEEKKTDRKKVKSDGEHLMASHGKETAKEELLRWIKETIKATGVQNLDDFIKRLEEEHEVTVRVSGNTISFKHPDLSRPVRGNRLAEDLDVKGIEAAIHEAFKVRYNEEYELLYSRSTGNVNEADREEEPVREEKQQEEAVDVSPGPIKVADMDNRTETVGADEETEVCRTAESSNLLPMVPTTFGQSDDTSEEEEEAKEKIRRLVQERKTLKSELQKKTSLLDLCRKKLEILGYNLKAWIREKLGKEKELDDYKRAHGLGEYDRSDRNRGGRSL